MDNRRDVDGRGQLGSPGPLLSWSLAFLGAAQASDLVTAGDGSILTMLSPIHCYESHWVRVATTQQINCADKMSVSWPVARGRGIPHRVLMHAWRRCDAVSVEAFEVCSLWSGAIHQEKDLVVEVPLRTILHHLAVSVRVSIQLTLTR